MTDTFEGSPSSKAFFEMFQIGEEFEVKSIIPCSLYETLLIAHASEINYLNQNKSEGVLFNYIKENLIIIDSNGKKLEMESVENQGRDEESKTMTFQLLFENSASEIKWVINTFLFDVNPNHANYHMISEDEEDYVITSVQESKFAMPTNEKNNRMWMIALLFIMMGLAVAIYQAKI
jgi:hypothetical protein